MNEASYSLDFILVWSGGAIVAPIDPNEGDVEPDDAESVFLTVIWRHLDLAEQLSTVADAMQNLDEVARHCEAVVMRIRAWQGAQATN